LDYLLVINSDKNMTKRKWKRLTAKSFREIKELLKKHSINYVASKLHKSATTIFHIAHSTSFADYKRKWLREKPTIEKPCCHKTHIFLFWRW